MDGRFISYLYCFNIARDYYECHEYGEHLWLETGRPVIMKGFIQAAVCLYHLHNGNVKGGNAMWQRARGYLQGARPVYEGIDVETLIADIDGVFALVPKGWRASIVPVSEIDTLKLPVVCIRILDEELKRRVHEWILPPIGEE